VKWEKCRDETSGRRGKEITEEKEGRRRQDQAEKERREEKKTWQEMKGEEIILKGRYSGSWVFLSFNIIFVLNPPFLSPTLQHTDVHVHT